jgi:hypothetical protein
VAEVHPGHKLKGPKEEEEEEEEEGWQEKVHDREECKKLLRMAWNCRILHTPME